MSTPDVIVTQRPQRQRYHCRYGRCDPNYPCKCVESQVVVEEAVPVCRPVGGIAAATVSRPRQRYYCSYGRCDPYYPCRCGNLAAYEMERQRQNMITREEMMIMGNDMIMEDMALMNGDVGMAQDIAMMGDMQMMQLEMERMW